MNIEETVERFIADFERNRGYGVNYFWREAYDRALTETEPARRRKSIAVAETILFGRRQQLRECIVDDPEATAELAALRVAIERLSVS
jgi:hypothetical protein